MAVNASRAKSRSLQLSATWLVINDGFVRRITEHNAKTPLNKRGELWFGLEFKIRQMSLPNHNSILNANPTYLTWVIKIMIFLKIKFVEQKSDCDNHYCYLYC